MEYQLMLRSQFLFLSEKENRHKILEHDGGKSNIWMLDRIDCYMKHVVYCCLLIDLYLKEKFCR